MFRITKTCYAQMVRDAEMGLPNEACGILAGTEDTVTVFYSMTNTDRSPLTYLMDPKEQLKVFKKMRELGVELTGIFHSHVASEAYPSQKDVRLAFYPEVSYLIVSLSEKNRPVLRSFPIREEIAVEEEIKIV